MPASIRELLRAGAFAFVIIAIALFFSAGNVEAREDRGERSDRAPREAKELTERTFDRVCKQLERAFTRLPIFVQLPLFCDETLPLVDFCPNIIGVQETVPEGYEKNASGDCVEIQLPPPSTENTEMLCSDTIDNDADSLIDLADPDCVEFVPPPPDAPVIAFSAEPNEIVLGGNATLSWNVTNATACEASSGWSGAKTVSDSEVVSPAATTNYTLTCTGDGGGDTETVTVIVHPDEPTPEFGHVIINEIAWMGTAISTDDEWIELYNPTNAAVNLSGWTLVAEDGTPSIALEGSIAPGEFFLLERADDDSVMGITADQIYPNVALENGGEILILSNATPTTVDSIIGGASWTNVGGNNTTKETPQRTVSDTWITATPTPKAATL